MGTSELTARGNPAMDKNPIQGGVGILLVAGNQLDFINRVEQWFINLTRLQNTP